MCEQTVLRVHCSFAWQLDVNNKLKKTTKRVSHKSSNWHAICKPNSLLLVHLILGGNDGKLKASGHVPSTFFTLANQFESLSEHKQSTSYSEA